MFFLKSIVGTKDSPIELCSMEKQNDRIFDCSQYNNDVDF